MHPRKTLLTLNSLQIIFFAAFSVFAFTLKANQDRISKFFDSQDLFYKFVYNSILGLAVSKYATLGSVLFIFAFVGLISFLIIHGNFRHLFFVPAIYYFVTIIFFPVGLILGFLSLYFLYVLFEDYGKVKSNGILPLEQKELLEERFEDEDSKLDFEPKIEEKPKKNPKLKLS